MSEERLQMLISQHCVGYIGVCLLRCRRPLLRTGHPTTSRGILPSRCRQYGELKFSRSCSSRLVNRLHHSVAHVHVVIWGCEFLPAAQLTSDHLHLARLC